MKILNEEHFENVKRYAESIGDTSLQMPGAVEELGKKSRPSLRKSHSTMTMPRTRSALHNVIPTEGQASWAVCSITEYRTALLP